MLNATVSLVWLLLAVFLVHPSDAQSLRWEPHDTEGGVPDGAVRVRLDRGLPLCKGAHAEIEDIKAAWPDVGTAYKGKCRTQRKKKALKVQEEFSILVAKMGDGAGAFNAIVAQTETLSGTLHEWTAAWSEASETIEETYGPHIDPVDEQMIIELIDFQEEELSEDDLPDFDGDGNYPVDAETLDAIYRTAADVEWRLASITGEIVFLHEFLTVSSFADEYAGVNEELAEDLFALEEELGSANEHWFSITNALDQHIEGSAFMAIDQGGNANASLGARQRSAISAVYADHAENESPGASISRSELETAGWNLSKPKSSTKKGKRSNKKKRSNKATAVEAEDEYLGNYFFVAWSAAFIANEVERMHQSVAEFADIVAQAHDEN